MRKYTAGTVHEYVNVFTNSRNRLFKMVNKICLLNQADLTVILLTGFT